MSAFRRVFEASKEQEAVEKVWVSLGKLASYFKRAVACLSSYCNTKEVVYVFQLMSF